ncbi:MAG: hypothetical protein ACXVXC_01425 [Nocardioidaceae bacterium]
MTVYALANAKLGVSGGWLQLLLFVERRPLTEPWRLWFTGGLVGGAVLAAFACALVGLASLRFHRSLVG